MGWGHPIRVNGWVADGRWFSNPPELILALDGAAAETVIPAIHEAVAAYPHAAFGSYRAWPGPNSNTFIAFVLARASAAHPELAVTLPPTAIGKDFALPTGFTENGTGVRVSLGGVLGLTLGWVDGIEANVLGLVIGLDLRRPALKLPGWGRVGFPAAQGLTGARAGENGGDFDAAIGRAGGPRGNIAAGPALGP